MTIYSNRSFRRLFALYMAVLFVCISLPLMSEYISGTRAEREEYENDCLRTSQNVQDYLDRVYSTITSTIYRSSWHMRYSGNTVPDPEKFDVVDKMEFCAEINMTASVFDFIDDIMLILPTYDMVISTHGWMEATHYERVFRTMRIGSNADDIAPLNDDICMILLENFVNRRTKSFVCVLINKDDLAYYIGLQEGEMLEYMSISIGDDTVYERGENHDGYMTFVPESNTASFSLISAAKGYDDTVMMHDRRIHLYTALAAALFASIILAYALACIPFRPIHMLLERFSIKPAHASSYESITRYIDDLNEANSELKTENNHFAQYVQRYQALVDKELLLHMMTDPDFSDENNEIASILPWLSQIECLVLIVCVDSGNWSDSLNEELPDNTGFAQKYVFSLIPSEQCVLLGFDDVRSADEYIGLAMQSASNGTENKHSWAISSVIESTRELPAIYAALRYELQQMSKVQCSLPIALQTKLMNYMLSNQKESCMTLVESIVDDYDPELMLSLLIKIAGDYDMDYVHHVRDFALYRQNGDERTQWSVISRFVGDICKGIHTTRKSDSELLGAHICSFIKENYNNWDMGVKLLSEKFGIHRTIVSKVVKEVTGESFSDYLLELRMKEALAMLKDSSVSMPTIAEKIGYGSYATFKRAFVRYQGMSPREYREMHGSSDY